MDVFDEMTKGEILMWLRGQAFFMINLPKKSDILWYRWLNQDKRLLDRRKANIEYGRSLNLVERDKLAKQFNATKDTNTKISLLKKMEPYEAKLQAYLVETKAIMKAEKKVDKLYS